MAENPPTDAELVQRCLAKDASAWDALVARYADLVYGVAWRSGLKGDDAGDVVQEVFLALLKHLGRVRDQDRLAGWILQTSRREAWRQVKRARAAARRDRATARPEQALERLPDEEISALEEEHVVRLAFRRISERCRQLLDALFFRGPARPYAEIAEELGVPVGSLGPTRGRCLEALRRELAQLGFPAPADVSGPPVATSGRVKRKRP